MRSVGCIIDQAPAPGMTFLLVVPASEAGTILLSSFYASIASCLFCLSPYARLRISLSSSCPSKPLRFVFRTWRAPSGLFLSSFSCPLPFFPFSLLFVRLFLFSFSFSFSPSPLLLLLLLLFPFLPSLPFILTTSLSSDPIRSVFCTRVHLRIASLVLMPRGAARYGLARSQRQNGWPPALAGHLLVVLAPNRTAPHRDQT